MRLDELPTSDRIEDRRRLPAGRAGLGIGTVLILGFIGWALGIDPRALIGGAEILSGSGQQQTEAGPTGAPSDQMGHFVSAILGSTDVEWKDVFAQAGKTYQPPTLVIFSGATQSACGFAQAAMGPFYCPLDQKVYLDTSFFQDLERRFRACDVGSKNCLAGVWANRAQAKWQFIEPGDVESALQTASAIGDDRLQRRAQGYVVGQVSSCDTFRADQI